MESFKGWMRSDIVDENKTLVGLDATSDVEARDLYDSMNVRRYWDTVSRRDSHRQGLGCRDNSTCRLQRCNDATRELSKE